MYTPEGEFPQVAAAILARVRMRRPRVHCITNGVAQAFTANLLLAAGATPSMTIAPEEVADFVAGVDALLVNLGTMDRARRDAVGIAVDIASEVGVRWMLDPVYIERSQSRALFAEALVRTRPTGIHLNADEFPAVAGAEGTPAALARYAIETSAVIAVTGPTDLVADGERILRIANGHPWMAKVAAMGCAGAALAAACLAVEPDPGQAVAAALLGIGVAGEIAAERAHGPGSLAPGILDAVHALDASELVARANVS